MNQFRRWFTRQKAPLQSPAPAFLRAGIGYNADLPGLELPQAQAELYQRLSWVQIAVSITGQTAAGAPFSVMSLKGEKTEAIENHPFELLLRRPNPLQSRMEFIEALIGYRKLTGNAYIWLNRATATVPPSEMWIIPSHKIEPVPDEKLYLKGYTYDPGDGKKIPLETWEVCHIKRFHPLNRFVGLSEIEALAVAATGDMAMSKWNANYFHKDHAKPAGALMFSDPINDSDWEDMKRAVKEEHGGTERKMMMMRNTGKGGVSWLQFGISQKDMEFLQGRQFNKEEIWATMAPGLSSMLAVNATEANSRTGKASFLEFTIWPLHQAIAERFTTDILPSYGENLVGEFDDVRVSDRAMELQEQQASYGLLTIQEAREKFYSLKPLGDERDLLLVSGVAPKQPDPAAETPASAETPEAARPILGYHIEQGVVTKNEARAGLNLPPQDDTDDQRLQDVQRRLAVVQAAVLAKVDLDNALLLAGLTLAKPTPEPQPVPTQLVPAQEQTDDMQPEPGNAPEMMDNEDEPEENLFRADLLHWQRKVYKRAKAGQSVLVPFESDVIPMSLSAAIKGALELAQTAMDVRQIFGTLLGETEISPARVKQVTWWGYP